MLFFNPLLNLRQFTYFHTAWLTFSHAIKSDKACYSVQNQPYQILFMTSLLCNYYVMCALCALYTLVHTRVSDSQPIASIFHTQIKPTMLAIFKGKISYPQMYNNGPSVITLVISLLANARLA